MKNYTITVNGNAYEVTVEEGGAGAPAVSSARRAAPAPVQAAAPAAPAPAAPAPAAGGAGSIKIEAGAAGKVLRVDAPVGTAVGKGDTVVTIESMKMEIPMVAPEAGTVASIDIGVGEPCEAGQVLATLN